MGKKGSFSSFPSPSPHFQVWLLFHFSRGQNRESRSSVFLCSETKRKHLLRRLFLSRQLNSAMLIVLRENKLCKTSTRHRKNPKRSGVVAVDSFFAIILIFSFLLSLFFLSSTTLYYNIHTKEKLQKL